MINPETLLSCAIKAAKSTGTYALQNISRRNEVVKDFSHDVKLKLDLECQANAEAIIRSTFPDHAILGEESNDNQINNSPSSDYLWIIDPIDGTVNFSHGFIFWCTSIAVQYKGATIAGAVYAPALNELFTATIDQHSMCNEKKISVSEVTSLSSSMIHTGMDRNAAPGHEPFSIFKTLAEKTQKARITGSAALDLCRVACGQADGYYESDIYIWDVAAAELIIKQAGGKTEVLKHLEGKHRLQYLASNGHIHEQLLKIVTQ